MDAQWVARLSSLHNELHKPLGIVPLLGDEQVGDVACNGFVGNSHACWILWFLGCFVLQFVLDWIWLPNGDNTMVVLVPANAASQAGFRNRRSL